MSSDEMITAYWKIFRTIESSGYQHLKTNAIPTLLHRFEMMYGFTSESLSLREQYDERVEEFEM